MLQKPQGNVLPAAPPTPPVPVKRYELAPPANRWLHTSLDGKALDYADFYPQKPNQVEDILNEASVRQGLMDRPFLNNETLSAYDLLVDRVKSDSTLATMTAFAGEVIRTKADARIFPKDVPQKVPFRANLSDANREQWIRDLKDPHIPLHVLEKTIPQGYKGDRLLEVLVVHQIPLVRATWFVKMVTVAESVSQKSKEKETNTTEWTRVVENSLQRFLADLSPPAPRPSANTDAPGLASPAQARTTFITKWKYLLKLARYHFVENLVDQKEFLQWILRQIRSATFDQTSLLLILISDYIDDMAKSRSLMRTFVEIALGRMERLRGSSPGGILESDQVVAVQYLEWVRIVQRCILAAPEAVVSPKWWSTCERVVENILLDVEAPDEMVRAIEFIVEGFCETCSRVYLCSADTVPPYPTM
ncbi:hypothetical protein M427DRAFT_95991 [Gonapodya prolifera JEL478]|uniref:Mediator of RNA polymerase II transcription subunit 12 n=1 Tax=Gonapodya prolifera (strain JEL478) TaxID=1344416 RepID=A0A139API3_GONPJ|nr:hypothetical protein M427DRAFT_95991 [Gonapodya prolifera JEL478]|eukprot:KXS18667.1 hypothetical protein M427DRAFT_95991 [Gonapodya prolifera JEL478]